MLLKKRAKCYQLCEPYVYTLFQRFDDSQTRKLWPTRILKELAIKDLTLINADTL